MLWEDVVLLLEVVEKTAQQPAFRDLHQAALAQLAAIDINSLTFVSQIDNEEGLDS